ncbi:hypothetical protein DFH28DRAFT_666766 [Melampsora americana]|nr:hypothetical protein DFH28DRAFT_666766 [Melampsora americana]
MSNNRLDIQITSNESQGPPVESPMDGLFEMPSNKTGNDSPAVCAQQNLLYRVGTAPRIQFDKRNEMTIQVKFKIHTEKEVEVEVEQPKTIKVASRVRKAATSASRYNLIESKMFNEGNVLDLVRCLFGTSLNEFKDMCGGICEKYAPGMRHMVLRSDLAPSLIWMGQVGRGKIVLVDYPTWQAFVNLLAKATKHKGSLLIYTENEKEKAKKVAQTCAAKELIASASGPTAAETQVSVLTKELEDARNRVALYETTAQLFHEQAAKGNSGDGAILIAPWDPNFHYCLTWNAVWIWAKAIQAGMATREFPPRTYEYLAIMKKSRVFHKAMKVDDRVKMRSAEMELNLSPTFHKSGGSHQSFFESPAKMLFQKPNGLKRSASFAALPVVGEEKKIMKIESGSRGENQGITIKLETSSPPRVAKGNSIVIYSDSPSPEIKIEPRSPKPLFGHGETIIISSEPPTSDSEKDDFECPHAQALESFLEHCNVAKDDKTTRKILKSAGVKSWTDLIPSVQFTENTLTSRGMNPPLATYLLSEAMERVNEIKDKIDLLEEDELNE